LGRNLGFDAESWLEIGHAARSKPAPEAWTGFAGEICCYDFSDSWRGRNIQLIIAFMSNCLRRQVIGSAIRERLSEFYGWSSGSLLFVNKKKQKNFVTWSATVMTGALHRIKVFCFFFSKKMLSLP